MLFTFFSVASPRAATSKSIYHIVCDLANMLRLKICLGGVFVGSRWWHDSKEIKNFRAGLDGFNFHLRESLPKEEKSLFPQHLKPDGELETTFLVFGLRFIKNDKWPKYWDIRVCFRVTLVFLHPVNIMIIDNLLVDFPLAFHPRLHPLLSSSGPNWIKNFFPLLIAPARSKTQTPKSDENLFNVNSPLRRMKIHYSPHQDYQEDGDKKIFKIFSHCLRPDMRREVEAKTTFCIKLK